MTISDARIAVERNSKGVYLMLRNKITNNRLSLLLDEGTKKLVLDSEISGEWTGADPIITKSDLDAKITKGQFVVKVEENIQKVITSQINTVKGTLPSQMMNCAYAAVGFSEFVDNELSIVVDGNSIIVSPKKSNNAVTINWFQFN